jgi:glycosyltransferase involved in cell wall biosynthesis
METKELTVLMPCLNEAETIETCVTKAKKWLEQNGVAGEVVIADNGSTDGSQELARNAGARVVPVPVRGYGAALQAGIQAAAGTYVIMGDADDSYDFSNLGPFLAELRAGHDLVMGNRFRGGISAGAMPLHHRYLGNPVLTAVGRILFRSPCKDFHCGLRGFNREAILALDLRTTGMEFASEMVVKATLNGLKITEVPTTLAKDGRSRPPHLRSWRDGWRHLRFLLVYSPRWLFLLPGLAGILLGLIVGGLVLPRPFVIGHLRLDIHVLLFASALVVVGYQAVIFAIFTKTFAIEQKLLPPDPAFQAAFKRITLEWGLVAGGVLFLAGLVLCFWVLIFWQYHSFGPIDPDITMRLFIPGVTAVILGVQTIFSSFFLSILGLSHR